MGRYDSEMVSGIIVIASLVAYLLLVPLVVYIVPIVILNFDAIQNPTHNITLLELILSWILVTIFVALPLVLIVAVLKLASSLKDSDDQEDDKGIVAPRIAGSSTRKRVIIISILLIVLFPSISLIGSNYHPYDEYSGGEIRCYDYIDAQSGIIRFSSLNEVDKKVFRMTINKSYLVSVRDDLDKTKEYDLLVVNDRGNDKIIIYDNTREREAETRLPPDGLLNKPMIDITESEYFSGKLREKQLVQYQGEFYSCSIDEFEGYRGA
jgi:heme/copper-type cytochrome/quinol oxidase subunit 2